MADEEKGEEDNVADEEKGEEDNVADEEETDESVPETTGGGAAVKKLMDLEEKVSEKVAETWDKAKAGGGGYEWAHYKKDSEIDEEGRKSWYHSREKTHSKSCYYIVECKIKHGMPSKICKIYLDEMEFWSQNYTRFTTWVRKISRAAKSYTGMDLTTQEFIEANFGRANENFKKLRKTEQGGYAPRKATELLNQIPFIRALPTTLYAYLCDFLVYKCDGNIDVFKRKLSKESAENVKVFYRYPDKLEKFEHFKQYIFEQKNIRHMFREMGQKSVERGYPVIPRHMKSLDSLTSEESNEFDTAFHKLVKPRDRYTIIKTTSSNDIGSAAVDHGTVYTFFPTVEDGYKNTTDNGISKYVKDIILNNWDIKSMGDLTRYGINIKSWIKKNNMRSNKFVESNRTNYVGIPALLNITPSSMKDTLLSNSIQNSVTMHSLGYYMFLRGNDYGNTGKGEEPSLFWHDRHITMDKYQATSSTYDVPDVDTGKVEAEKQGWDPNEGYVYAPLIFMKVDGKILVPPLFYSMTEKSIAYIKKYMRELNSNWKLRDYAELKKNDKSKHKIKWSSEHFDVRQYCVDFHEGLASKTIYYMKNANIRNTSQDLNKNEDTFYPYDNNPANQYNTRKRILPISQSTIAEKDPFPKLEKLIKLAGTETIGRTHTVSIKQGQINGIFGAMSTISDTGFYDENQLTNTVLSLIKKRNSIGVSQKGALMEKFALLTEHRLIPIDAIQKIGRFSADSLFFHESGLGGGHKLDTTEFFRYLFYKYSHDISVFSEWNSQNTFIRWGLHEDGTTIQLEPNMIMRLNDPNCLQQYNNRKNGKGIRNQVNSSRIIKLKMSVGEYIAGDFESEMAKVAKTVGKMIGYAEGPETRVNISKHAGGYRGRNSQQTNKKIKRKNVSRRRPNKRSEQKRRTKQKRRSEQKRRAEQKRRTKQKRRSEQKRRADRKRTNKKPIYNP